MRFPCCLLQENFVEQNILLSTVVWSYEKTSLCEELFWRWNMRFPCCSVLQENFVEEI